MTFGSPKKTDSLLHGSSGSTSRPSVIRPVPVRLQERTCWQALYLQPLSNSEQQRGTTFWHSDRPCLLAARLACGHIVVRAKICLEFEYSASQRAPGPAWSPAHI